MVLYKFKKWKLKCILIVLLGSLSMNYYNLFLFLTYKYDIKLPMLPIGLPPESRKFCVPNPDAGMYL